MTSRPDAFSPCRLLLARIALATLFALPAWLSDAGAEPARHPLWVLEGERNSVYLLGSIHVLRAADYPLPQPMERAYAEAEVLYMEIDLDDLDPAEAVAYTLGRGMLPMDQSLETVLGKERYAQASARARELGVELGMLSRFEPWVVALAVVQAQFTKLGLDPEQGVEKHFTRQSIRDGKEIRGLESLADQLGILDGLALERQAQFLMLSLDDADSMEEDVDTLVKAWRSGDSQQLARTLAEEFADFPDLYESLIAKRNRNWAAQIAELADDEDDYLVVVGALHLVGDDSVLELLRRRGLRAKQL